MTGKKFTDEEVIEALDLCTQQNGSIPCYDCPCWNNDEQECEGIDYTATLDLINCQKAEIERLKTENKIYIEANQVIAHQRDQRDEEIDELQKQIYGIDVRENKIKAEVYKEFARKLKEKDFSFCIDAVYDGSGAVKVIEINQSRFNKQIDNLLKEMIGKEIL